ncbi:hypothetical protein SISNIDRAFT_471056 [Sistotremastrum niveocremeum HHB9708]|uniref:Uncharacterized protein n=1 Tax=Sistotremastrum niveocremeum HHB9708 TaxID=1314777 RepID=A0A164N323_9AGAM|nr:hypothetical protein SISNIDRAFT_471056 [Sistotremastrum niveocremeum HHB9708]
MTAERISSTKIYSYDQITVISQKAINHQLSLMYRVNKTLQKISVKLEGDDYGGLEATLDAPKIELQIGTQNRSAYYFIYLKSGKLNYWIGQGRSAQEASCEIKDWVLALSVDLALESASFTQLPDNVKAKLKKLDDYSVQQLLIDFTSANISKYDASRSKIDIPKDKNYNYAMSYWNLLMTQYFLELANKDNSSVIHYLPKVRKPQGQYAVPTLPPTDLNFQTLPYVTGPADRGSVGENTMIVYLQMTGGNPMPRELLPISANWVVPPASKDAEGYDGTVALSKSIFRDGWLLPYLADFNRKSTWIVDQAYWKSDPDNFLKIGRILKGHLGWSTANDSDIKWTACSADEVDGEIKKKVGDAKGQWYKYAKYDKKDDDHGLFRVWMSGDTKNWMFLREGFNSSGQSDVQLFGKTRVDLYAHVDLPRSTGWVEGTWNVALVFDGVHDGELIIKSIPEKITPVINSGSDEAWLREGDVKTFFNDVDSGLKKLSMQGLIDKLTNALGTSWDFCLAGGDDFFIDKAVFNAEYDFLCQLKYKFKA